MTKTAKRIKSYMKGHKAVKKGVKMPFGLRDLAKQTGISTCTLSKILADKRPTSTRAAKALAGVIGGKWSTYVDGGVQK